MQRLPVRGLITSRGYRAAARLAPPAPALPRGVGHDVTGIVERVDEGATCFHGGDEVLGAARSRSKPARSSLGELVRSGEAFSRDAAWTARRVDVRRGDCSWNGPDPSVRPFPETCETVVEDFDLQFRPCRSVQVSSPRVPFSTPL